MDDGAGKKGANNINKHFINGPIGLSVPGSNGTGPPGANNPSKIMDDAVGDMKTQAKKNVYNFKI